MTASLPVDPPPAGKRAIFSWCLYDWANSAFNTVIGTFVFSVYFARGIYGDEAAGSAAWGYTISAAGVVVMILSPVLGAIADRVGRRKPWLAVLTVVAVIGAALLWYAEPTREALVYTVAVAIVANIAFELGIVFYNAMLPSITTPDRIGRVSGWGWGLGYFGGLACLALALVGFIQPAQPWFGLSEANSENVRATTLLVAAWYGLFSLPLFLFTPDAKPSGLPIGQAVRAGLRQLLDTARRIRSYANIVRYLIASAIYRDGMNALFAVGGLYAAGVFGMDFQEIIIFAISLQVTAGLGSFAFGWIDDAIGSKRTIVYSLIGTIATGIAVLVVTEKAWFFGLALALGIFVGPVQAASRSFMARLAPAHLRTEMFGLYALSGKSIAFLGPLAYAVATDFSGSQRIGMATVVCFFVVGLLVLLTVKEERG